MDGPDEFVKSRTAVDAMKGLETLMTGESVDDYNKNIPMSLLLKAARLTGSERYLWDGKPPRVRHGCFPYRAVLLATA